MTNFENHLKIMGNNYMKDAMSDEKFIPYEYDKDKIPLGKDRNNNTFCIDMSQKFTRIIVIGSPGSGKTYLLRSMMDRIKKLPKEYSILVPTDIKDEFKSSIYPAPKSYKENHLNGETETGLKIVTLRPTFFKTMDSNLPNDNHWISVDMSKMEELDFMTLLKVHKMKSDSQQMMMQNLYNKIKNETNFTITKLKEALDEMKANYTENQIKSIKNKLEPLFSSGFGDDRYYRDLVKGINDGNIISINMEDYNRFGSTGFAFPEVFVGMTLRKVLIARRKGKIPPLFVIIDEAGRFIPRGENPSCKKDIMESDKIDRAYGVSYVYATQYFSDLPEEVQKTCRYIFLPSNIDKNILSETLRFTGIISGGGHWQRAENDALHIIQTMKKFQWLVLDRVEKQKYIIDVLAPLSNHAQTKMN